MNLVQELIKNLLPEQEKNQTTAVYAGGFKPPTSGHFEVVEEALKQNPEIDEFIIFIGNKERNGISQVESLLIWEIYNNYLPFKVKIQPTSTPPIKAVYDFAKNHPTREVLWIIGAREGNEADFADITKRTKSITNYPNLELRTIVTAGGVSGTAARNAALTSLDNFKKFVPDQLSDKETEEVFNIVADKINEGRKKKKDPKKGTGKKPKGSGRRLYTDEDPTDTVKVKFSTRQDIVNTLAKKSFKAKSHARQSQIINLIHQRVRAALARTKDPKKKAKLRSGFEYIKKRKEASKRKTIRLNKKKVNEKKGFGKSGYRYRSIYKKDGKFYFMQDNPFSPGIRQEFGPYKTKEAAKRKMQSFPSGTSYRDLTEKELNEKLCKRGKNYIAKRKREGEKHNPFLAGRAVKVCKGQIRGSDGKKKKDFRPKKGKTRSAQGRKPDIVKEIGIKLSNYSGQVLPGDVLRAPKGFPLGGKKLEKSIQLKVIKNSREGVNRYKLSLEDSNGKKYTVRNFQMDGEYKGEKLPKWGMVRRSKKNLKENASYTQHIDIKEKISDFTDYMIESGLNIEPLPTLEFKNADVKNAKNFFGKTAYYDPNTQHIVLYTEGRHPKDILRSYAHEMIHHIQYLEDRLPKINTTNTNKDKNLDKIEKEAYIRGNMTFRNWTDSIIGDNLMEGKKSYKHKFGFNPKLGKDPFGLNAYARELALSEEEIDSKYTIYLDMDGVLANFNKRFKDISGMEPKEFEAKYGTKEFWNLIDEDNKISFWVGIEEMPGARALVNAVKKYNYEILTSPSAKKQSYLGKLLWVRNHKDLFGGKPRVNFRRAKEKHLVKPELSKNDILIDDREDTIERWNAAGGTGIHYNNISQTLNDLGKLGL